jgi:2-methylcitrate dehydratase PrpD
MSQVQQTQEQDRQITRTLADHAMGLTFDALPEDVVEVAKHCMLDWIGVTLAGVKEPLTQILIEQVAADGGAAQASVIGDGRKANMAQAALVNGSASHALDFDDVQERFHGHPTAPVAPVALALAESGGACGADVLTALVAGIEVECRVNVFMGDSHYERGWHSTATNGAFGAAVGASRMRGFDGGQCALAMGIAGTQAAGLRSMFGTMCKPLHAGKAAQNGLFAAQLVERGFTSRPDVLERPLGFGATQSEGTDIAAALAGLGDGFEVRQVLFKYHAACHGVHATIEALRAVQAKAHFDPAEIERVEVFVQSEYLNICGIETPATGLEGKFSLRFCAALALAGEDTARTETYSDANVTTPALVALMDKVTVTARPSMKMKTAEVAVHAKDGVVHRETYDAGIPDRDLPRQWDKLAAKFRSCAEPVLGAAKTGELIEAVLTLDTAKDLSTLVKAWAR